MNIKMYISKRISRILDAVEIPTSLVDNRGKLIDKMVSLWYKWKRSVSRDTKALVSDFKKAAKEKKDPGKVLTSKADKLYKSIRTTCLAYDKLINKLMSGTPTSAEMSKVGLTGKVIPIPRGIRGDSLWDALRSKLPSEDFGGFELDGISSEVERMLAPYYDVKTKTLKQPVGVATSESKTNTKAISSPAPEKPKTNTIFPGSSISSSKSSNAAQEDKIIKRLKEIRSRIKVLDDYASYIYFTKLNSLKSVGTWSDKELSEIKNKANKVIDEVSALIDEARNLWPKALNTDESWRLYQSISHDGEDESISPYKLSLKSIHAIDREFWARKHANELFNTFNIFPPHN